MNWNWKRFKKACNIFMQAMRGVEYVSRSLVADERLVEFLHPEHPGGCTREEIYFNATDSGMRGGVPVRPVHQSWTCTKCKQPVKLGWTQLTFGGEPNDEVGFDATCPCGQVDEHVDARYDNEILVSLRDKKMIF